MTQIRLQKGTSQSYTMDKSKTKMKFIFTPSINNEKSIIQVTSIMGELWFDVTQKDAI